MTNYIYAICELNRLLIDAKRNRQEEDPEEKNEKWEGFIQGIQRAIYRLETHHNG